LDLVDAIQAKLGILGVGISAVVAIIFLVGGALILWALGLIVAVAFGVIGLLFIYFFHKIDFIDAEKDRKIWFIPFLMFAFGFAADRLGVLSVQPLSVTDPAGTPATLALLVVIICLLVADIAVSRD